MASLLTSKEATSAAKAFTCRQLADLGTERHAPALASLLTDRDLAPAALAALGQIPGSAVNPILRESLRTLTGDLRIGVINTLGERRDWAAPGSLLPLLGGPDEAVACAAARALGKIGSEEATSALQKALATTKGRLRTEIAQACLACADQLLAEKKSGQAAALYEQLSRPGETDQVRMAALRGRVLANPEKAVSLLCASLTSGDPALESMALQLVLEVTGPPVARLPEIIWKCSKCGEIVGRGPKKPTISNCPKCGAKFLNTGGDNGKPGPESPPATNPAVSAQLAQCLGKTSPPVQTLLLGALALRRDAPARAAIEAAVASKDRSVRLAALNALGTCGDQGTVKILLDRLAAGAGPEENEAARKSLVRLPAPDVDEALAGLIPQRKPQEKGELIRILAARNAVSVLPDLKKCVTDPDLGVRKETWKALGSLAREGCGRVARSAR